MPKLTKKQSRELAPKSDGTDADGELVGATAPPSVSSTDSEGGATASPHSGRTEGEWNELVVALQEMSVANAELKKANAELKLKLRDEMAASAALRHRNPQRSHRSTSTEGRPCHQPPRGCPTEGVRPHSIASSAPHQASESNCRVDQYFQVPAVALALVASALVALAPVALAPVALALVALAVVVNNVGLCSVPADSVSVPAGAVSRTKVPSRWRTAG